MQSTLKETFVVVDDADIELRQLWRALFSNPDIAIAIVRLDHDGELRFVETSAAGQMWAALPWREVAGRTLKETMIPEVRDFMEVKLRLCLTTGNPQNYERAIDLPTGRVAWAANLIPVPDSSGVMRHVVAMARPIPMEFHAIGIEQRNRALVEGMSTTAPGIIFLYDLSARKLNFVGGQVESLLGYKPFELEEMEDPLRTLIHPDDLNKLLSSTADFRSDLANKVSVFECRVRQRSGEFRQLCCHNRLLDRNEDGTPHTLVGVADDVTSQQELKSEVRHLNDKLLTAQMDERRVIAQELHDSAGQYIVAAELALLGAQEQVPDLTSNQVVAKALSEVMECLKDAEREIRVLSYLMHPPAIGNQGLSTVLRNFTTGFGGRAGVLVDVAIDKAIDRAPEHLAIPILRICQEALTNVHRHAKATTVEVTLTVEESMIVLVIADDGIGFDCRWDVGSKDWGIGLSGMRERVARLGGSLAIECDRGTRLTVRLSLGAP